MMKYILKRMYYNILALVIVYIATALTNVESGLSLQLQVQLIWSTII